MAPRGDRDGTESFGGYLLVGISLGLGRGWLLAGRKRLDWDRVGWNVLGWIGLSGVGLGLVRLSWVGFGWGPLFQKPAPSFHVPLCRQLMENQISVVERGAFDDMKELERL